ncbi:N-acetylmuramoyl-L-alanine amidase [Streptomyces sp. 796.1]|uniref:peptidoglycan recognition protein family protein n=1 Tax=Streptomyces sp. 796.1 TaxID=3163029 RepID=UPI0039C91583
MRAYLASAVGVACTAALVLPLTDGRGAAAAPTPAPRSAPASAALPGSTQSLPLAPLDGTAPGPDRAADGPDLATGAARAYGLGARTVRPFSLVGVVWDDPRAELHGRVQVRTRAAGTARWSDWQDVQAHGDAPDLSAPGRSTGTVRGSTAPLWVGASDGVDLRVTPEAGPHPAAAPLPEGPPADRAAGQHTNAAGVLPAGLRLELVDPGVPAPPGPSHPTDPGGPAADAGQGRHQARESAAEHRAEDVRGEPREAADGQQPENQRDQQDQRDQGDQQDPAHPRQDQSDQQDQQDQADQGDQQAQQEPGSPEGLVIDGDDLARQTPTDDLVLDQNRAVPADLVLPAETEEQADEQRTWQRRYTAPRPRIVLRKGWSADERLRERRLGYTKTVKAAFVHHSATGNNYRCSQAPSVIRSIYRYHVKSSGWRDLGYNFLVDKCGNVYEGRAGGPAKPVLGAHTLGFNSNSTGIAVLGTFSRTAPPGAAVRAVAKLTAWKLGLHGRDPGGSAYLVSDGSNKYRKGVTVRLKVISGHRDGFTTDCPGTRLYQRLAAARSTAARLQGR